MQKKQNFVFLHFICFFIIFKLYVFLESLKKYNFILINLAKIRCRNFGFAVLVIGVDIMVAIREAMLVLLILLPFIGSVVVGFFRSTAKNNEAWFAGAVAVFGLLLTIMLYPSVMHGDVVRMQIDWLPQWGINIILRVDGLSWMFLLMITGIGLLVVIYARYYMNPADPVPRFFSFLLAFMGAMTGIVLSGNIIMLVIFWELTSIFSFLLIGYWYHNASARDGARMSLTITGLGGFSLLVGMLLLGHIVGSYDLDIVLKSGAVIRSSPFYLPTLILIVLGAFTKSAQFPFHFWLPNAMAAPTPVSAYLHSATMVKAGIFLLIRLWPVLSGTDAWFWILGLSGFTTFVLGSYFAMFQQDIKALLAYSTISHLGLITVLLSLDSKLACVAAIFHIANHATFKASLFMTAGIIDHETGTRDMRKLSGLARHMPVTATLAIIASAAMAGVPLLNGFLSKEMFFAETLEPHAQSWLDWVTPYLATLAGVFSVTYSVRFIHGVFFGPESENLPKTPHEPPHFMRLPIELLVFLCLLVGILPNFSIGPILSSAVKALLGDEAPTYNIALWHGFNTPLIMSFIALAGGCLLYCLAKNYFHSCQDGPPFFNYIKGQRIFERVLITISWKWARFAENILSTRHLQKQIRLLIWVAIIAVTMTVGSIGVFPGVVKPIDIDPIFVIVWIVGGGCTICAAWQAKFHRLTSLLFVSGAGLMVCLTFLWLSAPDLAITQLLVEVVTTVLILLGLRWLPKRWQDPDPLPVPLSARFRRFSDLVLAILAGGGLAWLSYAVMTRQPLNFGSETVADFFLNHAYSEGGGRNVINVILVDFRGFDTMGEISVLGIVALTVFSLLRRFRPAAESIESPSQQRIQMAFDTTQPERKEGDTLHDYLSIPQVTMHWLFPVIVGLALYLFMRGHDLPGGGFSAGVTMAIGFILQYLASGTRWVESHLVILPVRWIAVGLCVALATGCASFLFGYPFLTSYFSYVNIPFIGKMPTASVLIFDLGVFILVVGSTVLMLVAIAHQSIRRYRLRRDETFMKGDQ